MGILLYLAGTKGAYVGAGAMALAVFSEAVASKLMASGAIKILMEKEDSENSSAFYHFFPGQE